MGLLQTIFPKYDHRLLLSLAGVVQSACLADSFAHHGYCNIEGYNRCLLALLSTEPKEDSDVFGKGRELKLGVGELIKFCDGKNQNQTAIGYSIQILHLQKLLKRESNTQRSIQSGLEHARKHMQMYGVEDDSLTLNLAELYQSTISSLGFRIQIKGRQHFLQQDMIAAKVRLLLFAGVRFAFLWRQSGGHAHHLVTARRAIGDCARKLIRAKDSGE